jgi:hypothetical protein
MGTARSHQRLLRFHEDQRQFWRDRLASNRIDVAPSIKRFGEVVIPFSNKDGLQLELIEVTTIDAQTPTTDDRFLEALTYAGTVAGFCFSRTMHFLGQTTIQTLTGDRGTGESPITSQSMVEADV